MKKLFYKLFSKAERALMMKDLSALCRRRLILTLLIALPLVFAVAFPLLFLFVSAMVSPKSSGVEQFKNLLSGMTSQTTLRVGDITLPAGVTAVNPETPVATVANVAGDDADTAATEEAATPAA